jgi:hypothetical protein
LPSPMASNTMVTFSAFISEWILGITTITIMAAAGVENCDVSLFQGFASCFGRSHRSNKGD